MDESQILILGANGQIGTALRNLYPNARSADSSQLDVTNSESITAFDWNNVKIVINAAAYTKVDEAETSEGRIASWKVNATAVGQLAALAITRDITVVHISSDYVFDGSQSSHTETESLSPLGVYGQSKAAGDIAIGLVPKYYLIRTSWVIGDGTNFVRTMKSLAELDVKPSVVNDQIGRLSFTSDIVAGIKHLLETQAPYGTYNISNDGDPASWADIAKRVFELSGKSADDVTPVSTEQYYADKTGIAPRPLQSTLDLGKIKSTGFTPRNWDEALVEYLST